MDNDYNIDEIENFLKQEMNDKNLAIFKRRLETEEGLQQEVDFHTTIVEGIKHKAALDFRDLVRSTRAEMLQQENASTKIVNSTQEKQARMRFLGSNQILAAAASLAVLLVAVWWLFLSPINPERAFSNNFSTPNDVLSKEIQSRFDEERGFGINQATLKQLQAAMQDYQNGEFEQARQQLSSFQVQNSDSEFADLAAYYEALSAINTTNYKTAQVKLSTLANKQDFALQTDAQWYLALNSLNIGNIDLTKTLLESLQSDSKYGTAARRLLRRLR